MINFNQDLNFKTLALSSLDKVFADEDPVYKPENLKMTLLKNDRLSFQIAYTCEGFRKAYIKVNVESDLEACIRLRTVENVPVSKACHSQVDDNYLKTTSGLYPDLLQDLDENTIKAVPGKWRSLWIDIETDQKTPSGLHQIEISFSDQEGKPLDKASFEVEVIGSVLPKDDMIHTEWFYVDCLADFYQVEVFSEDHWSILETFFSNYGSRGMNMILTPLFTYTLDTEIGHERTTSQLIDIKVTEEGYEFSFDRLKRWVDLARSYGIEYFEMSHLFSQWGANHPPKIIAQVNGKEEQIFGWHTPALGAYTDFLKALLPALSSKLKEWGISSKTYFHVSDVPRPGQLESVLAARNSIGDLLDEYKTFDALNSYEYYENGMVEIPVAANNVMEDFLDKDIKELWTYYCTGQFLEVSNRFISMPSARARILGIQLYKFDITGFLHWGYNFYKSALSLKDINPYQVTDADDSFPAGDPFLVYPKADRTPEESLRMMVINEAFLDHRALKLLESLTSKAHVINIIEENLGEEISFKTYPKSESYLIGLRNKVNEEIGRLSK